MADECPTCGAGRDEEGDDLYHQLEAERAAHEETKRQLADLEARATVRFHGATPAEVRRLRAMERHFEHVIVAVDNYRGEGGGRWARRYPGPEPAEPAKGPTPVVSVDPDRA